MKERMKHGLSWLVMIALGIMAWRHHASSQPDPDHMGARVQSGVYYGGNRSQIVRIPLQWPNAQPESLGHRPGR